MHLPFSLRRATSAKSENARSRLRPSSRPTLEHLEDRTLLAAGALDPTFGTGGKVLTDFGGDDTANAVAIQADRKIVVVGTVRVGNNYNFALARYNPDGSLDTSFGTGGKVTTDFAGNFDLASAVAIQPDGKIVAAGRASGGFALARYNPDGSLNTSFGSGGMVVTSFVSGTIRNLSDRATSVAIQPDGKIVAAGASEGAEAGGVALARYNPDGSLDTSFGTGGRVFPDYRELGGSAGRIALQPDGKIVVAGSRLVISGPFSVFIVARYQADGNREFRITVSTDSSSGSDVVLRPDGKIVAVGTIRNGVALAQLNPDGSLDSTFGTGGLVQGGLSTEIAGAAVLQPDGKIVVAGYFAPTDEFETRDIRLLRFYADGSLDSTFGTGGRVTTDFARNYDVASALALQPDGKVVAAGASGARDRLDFALARYEAAGSALYVTQVYMDLLGRQPDGPGLAFWSDQLDRGFTRAQIAAAIQSSAEARARVVRESYRRLLGRDAEQFGIDAWVGFLGRGGTAEQMETAILASDEYFRKNGGDDAGFVAALYRDVLGRGPESGAVQAWAQVLAGGTPRGIVARVFQSSLESDRREVRELYRRYLRREADPAGLEFFAGLLQRGTPNEQVILVLVASPEYVGRA